MDELKALGLEALEERHDLERLLALWDEFRTYLETLDKQLSGEAAKDFELARLAVSHSLDDQEHRFLEWHEGEQVR